MLRRFMFNELVWKCEIPLNTVVIHLNQTNAKYNKVEMEDETNNRNRLVELNIRSISELSKAFLTLHSTQHFNNKQVS
ncbi:CLUMA_CG019866, isoform A [Clunio marinus]|uniref:CLUMA_CG019866, isoform A n=1 Tax=Clunio marinus TaxID=568069 RepID=A0A1J1J7P4_9DIPT|nr:CLUMA_CG019866, isoform A [Clunio marinus]